MFSTSSVAASKTSEVILIRIEAEELALMVSIVISKREININDILIKIRDTYAQKSVQLVRGSSFWSDFLQNPDFSKGSKPRLTSKNLSCYNFYHSHNSSKEFDQVQTILQNPKFSKISPDYWNTLNSNLQAHQ